MNRRRKESRRPPSRRRWWPRSPWRVLREALEDIDRKLERIMYKVSELESLIADMRAHADEADAEFVAEVNELKTRVTALEEALNSGDVPLTEGAVTQLDGLKATLKQMADRVQNPEPTVE
jgi:chromosome segregation ATPase